MKAISVLADGKLYDVESIPYYFVLCGEEEDGHSKTLNGTKISKFSFRRYCRKHGYEVFEYEK